MNDLTRIIDEALEKSGMTPAAASRAAVGNTSLIKNIRLGKKPSYENIARLAEVLNLECYVGPARPMIPTHPTSSLSALGPADVRSFQIGKTPEGYVRGEMVIGPLGTARFSLTPEQAKNLAARLMHQAVSLEDTEKAEAEKRASRA